MTTFNFLQLLSKGDKGLFDISVKEQQEFMSSLAFPRDNIHRSYLQFLCQQYYIPTYKRVLFNVISLFTLPFVILYFLLKGLFIKKKISNIDALGEFKGLEEKLPELLLSKYNINNEIFNSGKILALSDMKFIFKLIFKHQPFFALKIIIKISIYSYAIHICSPRAIIVHGEYSFTSSALTDYCHLYGVKHINVMHGEKLFYMRDSWFHFDECYVWDQHYIDLFKELHSEESQFIIAIPNGLKINIEQYYRPECYSDYKYYLTNTSKSELKSIVDSLKPLISSGHTIKFRPHPSYTDIAVLKSIVSESEIEYPNKYSIMESVGNTGFVIGSYSTVLLQAFLSGKSVLLDDVTYCQRYKLLKDFKYILAKKDMQTLSNHINAL